MADTSSLFQSPDDYLLSMIQAVQQAGSAITDFSIGSGARTLFEGLAAGLSQQSAVVEQLRQDSYLATAAGDALDAKAADFQVTRKAAIPAAGTLRITRPSSGTAVTIPAGWSTLLTAPVPGAQPVAFITTAAAVFGSADLFIDVACQAVEGGTAGNIGSGTVLIPANPVGGFDTATGFVAHTTFAGGVDAETDDQLRARVPLAVQGRVKGTAAAFLAAVLAIPGVISTSVLQGGDTRDTPLSGTVTAGNVEVYYEGAASLATLVANAVDGARVLDQAATSFQASSIRTVLDCHVFCLAGVDTVALGTAVKTAAIDAVNSVGVDQTLYASSVTKAIHDVADVISVNLPFTDLRKFTDADNTAGDVVCGNNAYPTLALADVAVTVTTI